MVRNQLFKNPQIIDSSSTAKNNENMIFIRKFVYTKFTNRSADGGVIDLKESNKIEALNTEDFKNSSLKEETKPAQNDEDYLSDLDSNDVLSPLTDSDSNEFLDSLILSNGKGKKTDQKILFESKEKLNLYKLMRQHKDTSSLSHDANVKSLLMNDNLSKPIQQNSSRILAEHKLASVLTIVEASSKADKVVKGQLLLGLITPEAEDLAALNEFSLNALAA